mmetsp:Transcript_11169/g.30825  ORF Transcript_11169/g.30825 Transcript_11169/m.30825 type:complete len:108 (-) Transcript_11169:1912-2235(-)
MDIGTGRVGCDRRYFSSSETNAWHPQQESTMASTYSSRNTYDRMDHWIMKGKGNDERTSIAPTSWTPGFRSIHGQYPRWPRVTMGPFPARASIQSYTIAVLSLSNEE